MNKKLQGIFELLELERAAIFDQLNKIEEGKLKEKPAANAWSVIQVIDHMIQVEKTSLLYLKKKFKAGSDIENASFSSTIRTAILILFLDLPFKFKAPKHLKKPENEKSLSEMLHIWNAVRKDIIKFLENYPDELMAKAIYKHPISGRIRMDQALHFFRAHQKHHKSQIKRTLKLVHG